MFVSLLIRVIVKVITNFTGKRARDVRYWVRLPRGTSLFMSVITRVMVNIITDFTGKRASERFLQLSNGFNMTQACCTFAIRTNWVERTGSSI